MSCRCGGGCGWDDCDINVLRKRLAETTKERDELKQYDEARTARNLDLMAEVRLANKGMRNQAKEIQLRDTMIAERTARLAESRATNELLTERLVELQGENARLQRLSDDADAKNLRLLKEVTDLRDESESDHGASMIAHRMISELSDENRRLDEQNRALTLRLRSERMVSARQVFERHGMTEPTPEQQDEELRGGK